MVEEGFWFFFVYSFLKFLINMDFLNCILVVLIFFEVKCDYIQLCKVRNFRIGGFFQCSSFYKMFGIKYFFFFSYGLEGFFKFFVLVWVNKLFLFGGCVYFIVQICFILLFLVSYDEIWRLVVEVGVIKLDVVYLLGICKVFFLVIYRLCL